ncbi:hypothetical protein B0H11DRAFT_2078301 [Mycena galericulata]|nr:hypothetical protein B0H11DRAFT_2078301 [Mycena galericulata]
MEPTFIPPPPPEVIDLGDSDDEDAAVTRKPPTTITRNPLPDFESDEEDDDENEVEEKPLIAPSTNIKADFEDALQEGFEFDGAFAFSERYAMGAAPNPCLNIDGLGSVGIPLSERDAGAIISACVPVSTSSGTSGIWEMSSEKVHFDNPAWDVWVQKTAGLAASTALTAYAGVRPSFTLKKLVIHEASPHASHHKEPISEDESDPKIGDFIAILPGLFQGAQLQLRHAGQVKSLNFAHQSGLSTSIVAAYSGVEHTLAGVTSGYRLSLLYDIVQPITHIAFRPTLPEVQGATQKLHNIMLSWQQDTSGEAPMSLACLLQHKYSKTPNFGAKSLTGADALLISHLYPLARQLKFRIYLAHVQVTATSTAEAEDDGYDAYGCGGRYSGRYGGRYGGYGRGWNRRFYDYEDEYDDMSDIDEAEFVDNGDEEETLRVTQVVDLRGMPVGVHLDLQPDDLLNGSITDEDPDENLFERDDRTSATRTKIYKRTVLLLWPKNGATDLSVAVGDIYDYACNALRSSLTDVPTKREKDLVDRLLVCCQTRPQEAKLPIAVQVLRDSADRWNDVQMLLRALKACGVEKNIDLMGVEGFVSAYQAFGWDALKDFYGDAMKNDPSNVRRNALLSRLTKMGVEEEDAEVSAWCNEQSEIVLRSLSKIEAAQIPWLADLALSRGGEFLRDVIFPQLQAQKLDKTFWMPFLQRLQQSMKDIPTASPQVVSGLIVQCVSETVRTLDAFPTKDITYGYGYGPGRKEKNSEAILEVIKFCVDTKNEALCTEIFVKMRDAARVGSFPTEFPPWLYYAELSSSLIQYMQTVPGLDAIFQPFFADVIDSMLSAARTTSDGKTITPCPLSVHHQSIIVQAARKAGGISVLKQRLTADKLKGHESSTLQSIARTVAKEFPRQQMQDPTTIQVYSDVVIALVRAAIDSFNTSSLVKKSYSYSYISAPHNASDQMMALVKFCFELGARSQCQRLLLRFVPPPAGSTVAQHVSDVLAPFLPVLRQYLAGKHLDFHTEPYKKFAGAVIKAFAEHVMGPQKPTEVIPVAQLQSVGCGACTDCQALKTFFLSEQPVTSFSRVQMIRTHLERQLVKTRAWGVSWQTIKSGSPHTLQVTKPASMTAPAVWSANSQKGKTLLHGLGDVATQAQILGADYASVYARIYGPATTAPMPLANANQTLNAPKRTATTELPTIPVTKKPRTS